MGHAIHSRDLSRNKSWRKATVQSLACALIEQERIITTLARAKEAQRLAERLVTLGKKGTLAARRRAIRLVQDPQLVRVLFSQIAPRFTDRQGGYTRVLHHSIRVGDGAALSVLEWVVLSEAKQAKAQGQESQEKQAPKPKSRFLRAVRQAPESEASTAAPAVEPEAAPKKEVKKQVKEEAPKKEKKVPAKPEVSPPKAKQPKPQADKPKKPDKKDPPNFMDGVRKFFKGRDKK